MTYTYQTEHTCSQQIQFELEDDIVTNVQFIGGCNGNLQAIARLVEGQSVTEIKKCCEGIRCGMRPTSCADQLTKALELALEAEHKKVEKI